MGNVFYSDKMTCFESVEACARSCPRFECLYVDKCNGMTSAHYACLPFDMRFFMQVTPTGAYLARRSSHCRWLIVAIFLVVVLGCSCLVAFYALRAIRASFR